MSFNIPNWKVVTSELIAYPLLTDHPALEVNPVTQDFKWNINLNLFEYSESLATLLFELHNISIDGTENFGLKALSIKEIRQELLGEIDLVKLELGIPSHLEGVTSVDCVSAERCETYPRPAECGGILFPSPGSEAIA